MDLNSVVTLVGWLMVVILVVQAMIEETAVDWSVTVQIIRDTLLAGLMADTK